MTQTDGTWSPGAPAVPAHRLDPLRRLRQRLVEAERVVLTTHVNADGDGTGCQAAVASWLRGRGVGVTIVNPTPYPRQYRFLLDTETDVVDWGSPAADEAVQDADLLFVLDTSEPLRITPLDSVVGNERILVLDHHPAGPNSMVADGCIDAAAAATGELVYDLILVDGSGFSQTALLGIYVAIVTDTGSFRFSNTKPRTHAIAADLLSRGIDAEAVYQQLFAAVPARRMELLREALATLRSDSESGLSWIVVTQEAIARLGATPEDLDNLVEYARSIEGTEVALFFRETADGNTKVSFRSNGSADVNRIARLFGGGGHVKASGATVDGPPADVVPRVIERTAAEVKR